MGAQTATSRAGQQQFPQAPTPSDGSGKHFDSLESGDHPSPTNGSSGSLLEDDSKVKAPPASTVTASIALYATCSSLMLVVNKLAVHFLPAPGCVLMFQLLTTALTVKACGMMGLIEHDELEWKKIKSFGPVSLAFVAAVFTNMKTLQYANIETFVIFRSSTPIIISVMDWMFLGRTLPSIRSWVSILFILIGATGYVLTDADYEVRGYTWVAVWFVVFTFDQVYIKYACDTVKMSNWGRVYYTNLLSCIPVGVLMVLFREDRDFSDWLSNNASVEAWTALIASCLCGIGMSYAGFFCRSIVSATMFTVVGIICKVATIVVNCVIWDKHATSTGLAFLAVADVLPAGTTAICLVGKHRAALVSTVLLDMPWQEVLNYCRDAQEAGDGAQ